MEKPTPKAIKLARHNANLSKAEAAKILGANNALQWQLWEDGKVTMSRIEWEMFLLKTKQHPKYYLKKK